MPRTVAGRRVMSVTRHLPIIARDPINRGIVAVRMWRELRGTEPTLVYSMPKVGTTSLASMIQGATGRPVVHFHYAFERNERPEPSGVFTRGVQTPLTAWRGSHVRRLIRRRSPEGGWMIVCGVRDPLARAVSNRVDSYFATHDHVDHDPDELAAVLLERVRSDVLDGRDASSSWFDDELRRATGIDVWAEPFDCDRGYHVFSNGQFRVLLIRFEDLRRVAPAAVAEFFGLESVPALVHENGIKGAAHGAVYDRLTRARFSSSCIEAAYSTMLARHFYSPTEIDRFRARWQCSEL